MKEVEILKDILYFRISNEVFYNECIIKTKNPEIRKLYTEMRDDEMRAIVKLQQRVARYESPPKTIAKIFTSRPRY